MNKKVLFIVPFLPYPLDSGGSQAIFNGIAAAIAAGAQVYLTYPERDPLEENRNALFDKLGGKIQIIPFAMHANRKGDRLLESIYKFKYKLKKLIKGEAGAKQERAPYEEWVQQMMPESDAYCRFVNELVAKHAIDIVQCEMLETLAFCLTLPQNVKKYFVHHELGFVRRGQHPIVSREPFAASAHLAFTKVIEIDLLNRFDTVITLSDIDSAKLQDAGVTTQIHTSFATIDHNPEPLQEPTDSHILSFVGPEGHPANKEGIRWFLNSCWKSLLDIHPDYQLQIIGNWTEGSREEFCAKYPNLHFLGYVDQLATTIRNSIMIVPITIGSGIRMKILEASLIGVPFVTTTIGVEGLPFKDGDNCFIADTPDSFVQSILKLSDPALRKQFIASAQELIKDKYSLSALTENRKILYTNL